MKKLVAVAALVVSLGSAYAGQRGASLVGVDPTTRVAYGTLADARSSADPSMYIGCSIQGYPTAPEAMCFAASTGKSGYCFTSNPGLVQAAASLKSDGYVYFRWDASGTCTYIYQSTSSQWAPKQP